MPFRNNIEAEYFQWLYDKVCNVRANRNVSYKQLFLYLYKTEFTYIISRDSNRAMDGEDLRYRFGYENGDEYLGDSIQSPCSVLEMLIGLSVRCEENIMSDSRYGDRTSQWFWTMISNLGLGYMTDDVFDERDIDEKITIFLNREYTHDGKGNIFYIPNSPEDLRDLEIWYQLLAYINYVD
jgi:hypothetical protein